MKWCIVRPDLARVTTFLVHRCETSDSSSGLSIYVPMSVAESAHDHVILYPVEKGGKFALKALAVKAGIVDQSSGFSQMA